MRSPFILLFLACLISPSLSAQHVHHVTTVPPPPLGGALPNGKEAIGQGSASDADRIRQQMFENQRRQALRKEADQLMKLSGELKDYVDQNSQTTFSLDALHKTEDIEKLAKKIRGEMKAH
jgi:hypothetical protein